MTVPELLAALLEQTNEPSGAGARALRADRHRAGRLAAAWRHITHRQARAVLVLLDARLAVEAQINARACLEHAVLLQRLALAADDDQLEPLLHELRRDRQLRERQQLTYLDDVDARGGGFHSSLLAAARADHDARRHPEDPDPHRATPVRAHFDAVPDGVDLHSVYAALSENSHAGLASATPYLLRSQQADQPVPARPDPVRWAETLAVLCWACWAADDAMRRFLVDGYDLAARHLPVLGKVGLT